MKSTQKATIILMVLGIFLALSPIINYNFTDNQDYIDDNTEFRDETNLKSPKKSGYWTTDFIHIQNDNWSDTFLDWIQVGAGTPGNPHIIENVTINAGGTGNGILIEDSSEYFIIRNCSITNAGTALYAAGIKLKNTNNGTLINNNCSDNGRLGILLISYCNNNTISGNIASNVGTTEQNFGILLRDDCDNNTISGNTANDHLGWWGIRLEIGCDNNTISGNTASNVETTNQYNGIGLFNDCNDNTISGNTANDNLDFGIYLENDCDDNIISENTAGNDGTTNQNLGIRLESDCDDNTIVGNIIKYNQNWGIIIFSGNCENNLIYQNSFIGTVGWHARDSGINNHWNTSTVGNYWDNHTSPDSEPDGIVDDPYTWIFGVANSEDSFPLVESPVHVGNKIHIDDSGASAPTWSRTSELNLWCTGSGTYSDPYVIDGLEIDGGGTGSCILIGNSSVYFIIKKCTVYNCEVGVDYAGIYLNNTANGRLEDNFCSNNGEKGITLEYNCNNIIIKNNTINNNGIAGIRLRYDCYNIIISENTIKNNGIHGVRLGDGCDNNTISGNIASNDGTNNQEYGIRLSPDCDNNTISENTANNNNLYGIFLEVDCDNNTISGNTASNDGPSLQDQGIRLMNDCDYNIISENTANDNSFAGIYLEDYCDNNTISGNTANNNGYGIRLSSSCNDNTISGNTVKDNFYGIYLSSDCDDNVISENLIKDNQDSGINIVASNCENNLIYQNSLIGTVGWHARDSGTNNHWNTSIVGNYWDNHTSPDSEPDGIVDDPYIWISGVANSEDNYPLTESPVHVGDKIHIDDSGVSA